eukprot:CAMPEP_0198143500 /NCGR_PEP_ID=MMETSP1443-20131203/8030_1 /TAXON_ID=186043 /ORGANISM="Entomoneis sp., Strain CCMP2396" /LENGTH=162 /DNA_ID=CAMNT_0043806745 /DNA_START=48 /DNA_END=536 /DNA_ORIENTATION=-
MSNILEEIKSNSIETLHLSKSYEEYFPAPKNFVEAVTSNTSIKKVIFDQDFLACCVGKDRATIVSSIGMLPNLESVMLSDSLLMVGICITNLVKNSKKLKEISMESCLLQGILSDFDLLKIALEESGSVKTLHIGKCTAPNDQVDLSHVMDSLSGLAIDVSN